MVCHIGGGGAVRDESGDFGPQKVGITCVSMGLAFGVVRPSKKTRNFHIYHLLSASKFNCMTNYH